jgi:hypothetical protein
VESIVDNFDIHDYSNEFTWPMRATEKQAATNWRLLGRAVNDTHNSDYSLTALNAPAEKLCDDSLNKETWIVSWISLIFMTTRTNSDGLRAGKRCHEWAYTRRALKDTRNIGHNIGSSTALNAIIEAAR